MIDKILPFFPTPIERFIEPFLGSGALLFHLAPQLAEASDVNQHLIDFYTQVRDNPQDLLLEVQGLTKTYNKSPKVAYLDFRDLFNMTPALGEPFKSALFVFLNKTCFNGLWRVNSKDRFNVPFGNRIPCPQVIEPDNFWAVSKYLQENRVALFVRDFSEAINEAQIGDLIFADPPYVEQQFKAYSSGGFTDADHLRMVGLLLEAHRRGVKAVVTNSAGPERFPGFKHYVTERSTSVSGYKAARGKSPEHVYVLD